MRINDPAIVLERTHLVAGSDAPGWQRFARQFQEYFAASEASGELPEFPHVTAYPCLGEDTESTEYDRYYFYQNTWAAKKVFERRPRRLVDVGSTVLYAGMLSQFVPTTFFDIRPYVARLEGYSGERGSITQLPLPDGSVPFLTSLCVIEHIGLGRYGDPIQPFGSHEAGRELARVVEPGGEMVLSTNIGPACIAYNAHRIFTREQVLSWFPGWEVLDEACFGPDPLGREIPRDLEPGHFVVWTVHLRKPGGSPAIGFSGARGGRDAETPRQERLPGLQSAGAAGLCDSSELGASCWAAGKVLRAGAEWFADLGGPESFTGILSESIPCTSVIASGSASLRKPGLVLLPGQPAELPFATTSVPLLASLRLEALGDSCSGTAIPGTGAGSRTLEEIDRVLRPGGQAVLAVRLAAGAADASAPVAARHLLLQGLPGYHILDESTFPAPEDGASGRGGVYAIHVRKPEGDDARSRREEAAWNAQGRPAPPPHSVKIRNVREWGRRHRLEGFLETGTYLGATTDAARSSFSRIATIELQTDLARRAREVFARDERVRVFQGDSGSKLAEALAWLGRPSLLWLDGHYSGGFTAQGQVDTPVVEELRVAASYHEVARVILIDDARLFVGRDGYPTLPEMSALVARLFPNHRMDVEDDAIRIFPATGGTAW